MNKAKMICYRLGCGNPVTHNDMMGCGKHGGVTAPVYTIYNFHDAAWLTDNDTLIDWVHDVGDARWFETWEVALQWLVDNDLVGTTEDQSAADLVRNRYTKYEIVRLK